MATITLYDLRIDECGIENTFASSSHPYAELLLLLKTNIDSRYKHFLNSHGYKDFCKFKVVDPNGNEPTVMTSKGIYLFMEEINNTYLIRYIGMTTNSFKNRFYIAGYSPINARATLRNGQSTNCHVNSEINKIVINEQIITSSPQPFVSKRIKVGFIPMKNFSDQDIDNIETKLIQGDWSSIEGLESIKESCSVNCAQISFDIDALWNVQKVKGTTLKRVSNTTSAKYRIDGDDYEINKCQDGKISLSKNGSPCSIVKPELRNIAEAAGYEYNTDWNTRQLGRWLINKINNTVTLLLDD